MRTKGFVLQATYRIEAGVPVVHVYGALPDGTTFLAREHRQTPHFYVRESAAGAAERFGAADVRPTSLCTMDGGEPVVEVAVRVPGDAPSVRERLQAAGVTVYEGDVRFAMRYLIDRNIRGDCEIDGEARPGKQVRWVFDDPELRPAEPFGFEPRVLSFDIETDPRQDRLLAISFYGLGLDEVIIVDPDGRDMPEAAIGVSTERDALDLFCDAVHRTDPDVLTGWNVIDFDLSYLADVARRTKHPFELGREPGKLRIRPAQGYFGSGQASIPGRLVLDGADMVRGAFIRMEEYSLDAVARSVLGEGKAVTGDVRDRVGEILDGYANDLPRFAHYARTDARLVLDILQRLDLVSLAVERSRLTGMPLDRVSASIASFDFVYLARLRQAGLVAPSVSSSDARVHAAQAGGHVFEPATGLHENVWVFDFKSLYPSLIRTFNIDPVAFTEQPQASDIVTVSGTAFRPEPGILPAIIAELFPRRAAAKARGDMVASQAIKILMNSFYGVLGTPACRFYNPAIANAITAQGRYFLEWARTWFEERGYPVLYGDTDSLFVRSGDDAAESASAHAGELATQINTALAEHIEQRWGVTSHLELEFEKLYTRLLLPAVRGGTAGARKRYAGVVYGKPEEVEFVGLEVVRRDWTDLAKRVQRGLYQRLFRDEPVESYLRDLVAQVRSGGLDHELVYRKGLRKRVEEYTANTPPHVAAARKSGHSGRIVKYVMTVAGPEPVDRLQHTPDREHYVDKQVRPVAEPVLAALGLSFERVIGDDRQLGLF